MRLEPHQTLTWLDNAYVDYCYGVGAGEAKTGRAACTGTSTVNTKLGLRLKTELALGHMVMMDVKHTFVLLVDLYGVALNNQVPEDLAQEMDAAAAKAESR